jgi:hypothetical protein
LSEKVLFLKTKMFHSQFASELECLHCDAVVSSTVWPLNGDGIAFYFEETPGTYSVEINCPTCGERWFVVWDEYPGPIEKLETGETEENCSHKSRFNPQLYLITKATVQKAISEGVVDFEELVRQAEEGLSGLYDIDDLLPLLRKAWIELHRGH